jgi:nucleotide-binding universal stress UspA family protein
MQRILLVLNANNPDLSSINFACKIADVTSTRLTGLLVENLYFSYVPATGIEAPYFETYRPPSNDTVVADIEQATRIFKEQCKIEGITAETIVDKGDPIEEIIFESRFADLVVIDPAISFYGDEERFPSPFVKEILARAECPVLLAPEKFERLDEIVFCYDGSMSSIFAVKQFTYVMPEFKSRKVTLLHISNQSDIELDETDRRMMDWLRTHYPSVCYYALKGEVKDELFKYFFMKKNKFIVIGAYGRSTLSNFFKKSNADVLIRTVDLPLFITHK